LHAERATSLIKRHIRQSASQVSLERTNEHHVPCRLTVRQRRITPTQETRPLVRLRYGGYKASTRQPITPALHHRDPRRKPTPPLASDSSRRPPLRRQEHIMADHPAHSHYTRRPSSSTSLSPTVRASMPTSSSARGLDRRSVSGGAGDNVGLGGHDPRSREVSWSQFGTLFKDCPLLFGV
jgi:hypothetical protein